MPPQQRVTLADVAQRAGVSRALVSIVMRGVPGASDKTRSRVLGIADELGYRPDARARMLAQQRSKLIGVVFGTSGTFHFELLDGLYAAAAAHGYELILSALTPGRDEKGAVESLLGFRLDALVMLGPHTQHPVMTGKMPLVTVGWSVPDERVDVVRTSDEAGMEKAITHLASAGHRRIWHLDGGDSLVSRERARAYRSTMSSLGLDDESLVLPGGENQIDGSLAARRILEGDARPTAIVAFNDEEAVALSDVMRLNGVRVPEDLSVIGWDDSPSARLPHIQLTTIRQDPHLMGRLAIEQAIARAEGRFQAQRETVLEPALVVRSSTSPRA